MNPPLKFGLHFQLPCAPGQSPTQRFRDTVDQAVRGEAMGFESVWPVEQHFAADASILPSPLLLLAAIAARTTTLRLGTAILLLPLAHPLRVAEDVAVLDVLSGGRVECGVGRGMDPSHFAGFRTAPADSQTRLLEAMAILHRAWTQERWSYEGRFWSVPEVTLAPRPVQSPHPPLRVAANSRDTIELAGTQGLPVLTAGHVNPLPRQPDLVAAYREARQRGGHRLDPDDVSLLVPLFVGSDEHTVRRAVEPGLLRVLDVIQGKLRTWLDAVPAGPAGEAPRARLRELAAQFQATTYETFAASMALFGTPAEVADRLAGLRAELGMGRVIAWFNPGGLLPHGEVLDSMELFATEVIPQFDHDHPVATAA